MERCGRAAKQEPDKIRKERNRHQDGEIYEKAGGVRTCRRGYDSAV